MFWSRREETPSVGATVPLRFVVLGEGEGALEGDDLDVDTVVESFRVLDTEGISGDAVRAAETVRDGADGRLLNGIWPDVEAPFEARRAIEKRTEHDVGWCDSTNGHDWN